MCSIPDQRLVLNTPTFRHLTMVQSGKPAIAKKYELRFWRYLRQGKRFTVEVTVRYLQEYKQKWLLKSQQVPIHA